jgi:hypothetical protein
MTAITRILKQRAYLCRRALERTSDVNEAYLAVHAVMVFAMGRVDAPERDLDRDLTGAFDRQTAVSAAT